MTPYNDFYHLVGQLNKEQRKLVHLTQLELAQDVHVDVRSIKRLESGKSVGAKLMITSALHLNINPISLLALYVSADDPRYGKIFLLLQRLSNAQLQDLEQQLEALI